MLKHCVCGEKALGLWAEREGGVSEESTSQKFVWHEASLEKLPWALCVMWRWVASFYTRQSISNPSKQLLMSLLFTQAGGLFQRSPDFWFAPFTVTISNFQQFFSIQCSFDPNSMRKLQEVGTEEGGICTHL